MPTSRAPRVKTGVTYRFEATLTPNRKNMLRGAEVHGRICAAKSEGALAKAEAEVAREIRIKDPVLGTLVRPPRAEAFEGRVKVLGRSVPLLVNGSVARASALVVSLQAKLESLPPVVAQKMLRLANDVWLDEQITERELLRRLKPSEVVVFAKSVTVSFSCGDTFGDHGIAATSASSAGSCTARRWCRFVGVRGEGVGFHHGSPASLDANLLYGGGECLDWTARSFAGS